MGEKDRWGTFFRGRAYLYALTKVWFFLGSTFILTNTGWSADSPESGMPQDGAACRTVESDATRLKCYDEAEKQRAEQLTVQDSRDTPSLMGGRWELDPGTDHGIFSIRPHKQAYLLPARTTNNVNNQASSPTQGTVPESLGYINTEVKFQISFKVKALDVKDRFGLWIGHTQLSFFQMYNKSISAPFERTTMNRNSWASSIRTMICLD